ncbi:hypothetical protein [Lentzea sp. NPDC051838]|uniref:hypothetical protein n=1 Tax=Lentzea sp. NPDC051838 TaxID=3154849 RepID=UPI003426EEF6
MKKRTRLVSASFVAALAVAMLSSATSATAGPADLADALRAELDTQIADQLKQHPAARRTSVNELAWQDGTVDVVLTLPIPGQTKALAPDCPFRSVCVYEDSQFNGRRLTFTKCGTASIGFLTSSWHNNQTVNTESWLIGPFGPNLQSNLAPSKVSYVGDPANDAAIAIHVC